MTRLTQARRWAALEAVWCGAADTAARQAMGGVVWQALGACGARSDLPWTAEPEHLTPWDAETMRVLCARCPVLTDCAAYVEEAHVTAGWWAGTHRDPNYVPPAKPGWVHLPQHHDGSEAWQGTLPLGGVA